jgi:hypothetical protein
MFLAKRGRPGDVDLLGWHVCLFAKRLEHVGFRWPKRATPMDPNNGDRLGFSVSGLIAPILIAPIKCAYDLRRPWGACPPVSLLFAGRQKSEPD